MAKTDDEILNEALSQNKAPASHNLIFVLSAAMVTMLPVYLYSSVLDYSLQEPSVRDVVAFAVAFGALFFSYGMGTQSELKNLHNDRSKKHGEADKQTIALSTAVYSSNLVFLLSAWVLGFGVLRLYETHNNLLATYLISSLVTVVSSMWSAIINAEE